MEKGSFLSVIYIENFPSRTEIMDLLTQFFIENKKASNHSEYTCVNKSNSLSITFPNSDVAYAFMKTLNAEKNKNQLYKNLSCSLTFKPQNKNYPLKLNYNKKKPSVLNKSSSIPINRVKLHLNSKLTNKQNNLNSSRDVLKHNLSYQRLHWQSISEKAGVITTDSPYVSEEDHMKKQNKENRKKWICQKNFNLFVGKATTNKSFMIKNYVSKTPSNPPVLYNFREIHKNKWIDEKGFMLC